MIFATLSASGRSRQKCRTLFVVYLSLLFLPIVAGAQQTTTTKNVLVVYWYHKDYPWNSMFDQSFQSALKSTGGDEIVYHAEYLETNRFPHDQQYSLLHDYLKRKYADQPPDVVVATSDASLDFVIK